MHGNQICEEWQQSVLTKLTQGPKRKGPSCCCSAQSSILSCASNPLRCASNCLAPMAQDLWCTFRHHSFEAAGHLLFSDHAHVLLELRTVHPARRAAQSRRS